MSLWEWGYATGLGFLLVSMICDALNCLTAAVRELVAAVREARK